MNSKKIAITFAVLAFVLFAGFGSVYANSVKNHPMADKVAEKFGLNADEVNEFFGMTRQERREFARLQKEEALSRAVADGVITDEQKNLITERHVQIGQRRIQNR
jgi:hypothetical protein